MKFDLHCHTYFSDGTQSPAWIVERAQQNGVTHLAITDHDALTMAPASQDLQMISGIEVSCHWNNREIHVVGLLVDSSNESLQSLVLTQQASRRERAEKIDLKLKDQNVLGLLAYLEALPALSFTRSHMANFLVSAGFAKNRQKAFKQYLAKGARAYVPANWCELATAVKVIRGAGGIAVLAHPGRYPLNKRGLTELVEAFSAAGGDALEARYPNIDPNMTRLLESLAEHHDLYLSGGSDFHDPEAHWTDVGKFPAIRGEVQSRAIAQHPRWLAAFD